MRLALVAALVLSTVSFAQSSPGTQGRKERKTEIIFSDTERIDGETMAPLGTMIDSREGPQFKSLIRVRENFNDKLRASVNDLR